MKLQRLNQIKKPKVNFVIAGAQKCGTTTLVAYLRQHPDIFIAEQEGHFFDRDRYFESKDIDYDSYHNIIGHSVEQPRVGESTPIYMYWKPAAKRIQQYNPAMKILVLLRCPVARAYSAWNMERVRGRDETTFAEAVQIERDKSGQVPAQQNRISSYIDRGFYAQQLEHLWQYFPKEQTLVLPSKQLKTSPEECLSNICDFLELPRFNSFKEKAARVGIYESRVNTELEETLQALFCKENRRLEQLLGWDREYWLN